MLGHPFDIVTITHGDLSVANMPIYRAVNPLTADPDDVEEFGDCDVFMGLGVTSRVWPRTDEGAAEGVLLRDCGNTDGVIIGARDDRCAFVYGALSVGDTAIHSVEPDAAAQVQCKANRQVMMVTKDSGGDNIMANVDGKNDKIQIAGWGGLVELSKDGGLTLVAPGGGASIMLKDDTVMIVAQNVMLGGAVPVANIASWVPPTPGAPSIPGTTVFKPAPNVWVGAA
jgi:hypothetical protein